MQSCPPKGDKKLIITANFSLYLDFWVTIFYGFWQFNNILGYRWNDDSWEMIKEDEGVKTVIKK